MIEDPARHAKKEIRASGGAQDGDQFATFGLILGWIHIAVSCVGLIAFAFGVGTYSLMFFRVVAANVAQHH